MEAPPLDDALYSRQRYVLGTEAMVRMSNARVFLSGLGGLGVEVAKNVILGGVKGVTLHDTRAASHLDLGSQFYLTEEHVRLGTNRAQASLAELAQLNPYVAVDVSTQPLHDDLSALCAYSLVVLADASLAQAERWNAFCRHHGIKFIATGVVGVFGWSFVDVGTAHEVTDGDGEAVNEIRVARIEAAADGGSAVTTLEGEPHELQEGDWVAVHVSVVDGALSPHPVECRVRSVLKSDRFVVDASLAVGAHPGHFIKLKKPFLAAATSLRDAMARPRFYGSDFGKCGRHTASVFLALRALDDFARDHGGHLPSPWSALHATELVHLSAHYLPLEVDDTLLGAQVVDSLDETVVRAVSCTAQGCLQPLCALFGGSVGQEVQKALSGKFTPQHGFLVMDALEVLATKSPQFDAASFALRHDRTDALRICVGDLMADSLQRLSLFMIGVGAIGCELVKNFAMLHCCTHADAALHMTDPDLIEKSNLNRQFLFRPSDIQKPKSTTAARAVAAMNPAMHVVAALDKVCAETEATYSDAFFQRVHVVVNALDNVAARRYVDGRCVSTGKPLLESGTLGTKGHVQVIVPHLTCSYTDVRDPPGKDIPFCTLKSFPSKIEHTIEWSRDLAFDKQFTQKPTEFNKILEERDLVQTLLAHPQGGTFVKTIKRAIRMLEARPQAYADCVRVARLKFEAYFVNAPKQLLHLFPADHRIADPAKSGEEVLFWAPPKRAPIPLRFDADDFLHISFVQHYANLHARMWGLEPVADADALLRAVRVVAVPHWSPKEGKTVVTDPEKKAPTTAEAAPTTTTDRAEFERLLGQLGALLPHVGAPLCVAQFEKDDDTNSHIDLIAACANLRGLVYQIKPVDRLEAKRIAGRIIPAIATTTSVVSAHVALELIKVASAAPLEDYRNVTVNLALPFYLYAEPDPAHKQRLGDVSYTKWDNWDVRLGLDVPVSAVMEHFQSRFGLQVQSIVHGASIVYHEDFMPDTEAAMRDCLGPLDKGAKFAEIVVMFHGNKEANEVLSGPAVRYHLKAPVKKRKVKK